MRLILALAAVSLLSGCAYTRTTERNGTVTESWGLSPLAFMPTSRPGDIVDVGGVGLSVSLTTIGVHVELGPYRHRFVATDDCGLALDTDRPDLIPDRLSQPCGRRIP